MPTVITLPFTNATTNTLAVGSLPPPRRPQPFRRTSYHRLAQTAIRRTHPYLLEFSSFVTASQAYSGCIWASGFHGHGRRGAGPVFSGDYGREQDFEEGGESAGAGVG